MQSVNLSSGDISEITTITVKVSKYFCLSVQVLRLESVGKIWSLAKAGCIIRRLTS